LDLHPWPEDDVKTFLFISFFEADHFIGIMAVVLYRILPRRSQHFIIGNSENLPFMPLLISLIIVIEVRFLTCHGKKSQDIGTFDTFKSLESSLINYTPGIGLLL
jgi:hypothetical protein